MCLAKTVVSCPAGEGYSEGTASADDSACGACAPGMFSQSEDTSGCIAQTVGTCEAGMGYTADVLTPCLDPCARHGDGWEFCDGAQYIQPVHYKTTTISLLVPLAVTHAVLDAFAVTFSIISRVTRL